MIRLALFIKLHYLVTLNGKQLQWRSEEALGCWMSYSPVTPHAVSTKMEYALFANNIRNQSFRNLP
jgi:hypothetical protein